MESISDKVVYDKALKLCNEWLSNCVWFMKENHFEISQELKRLFHRSFPGKWGCVIMEVKLKPAMKASFLFIEHNDAYLYISWEKPKVEALEGSEESSQ